VIGDLTINSVVLDCVLRILYMPVSNAALNDRKLRWLRLCLAAFNMLNCADSNSVLRLLLHGVQCYTSIGCL